MSEIKDSGNRTEFTSGAVRDIQEDKGRCDLMPLDVVSGIVEIGIDKGYTVLSDLEDFKSSHNTFYLERAFRVFVSAAFDGDMTKALLETSIHFAEGAKKYGENNWQKGIPEWSYLSSAVRHYLKWLRADEDERHDRAFLWNIMCLMWTVENGVSADEE